MSDLQTIRFVHRTRPTLGWRSFATTAVLALLVLTSCAAGDPSSGNSIPDNYPTIAPAVVQGRYEIIEVVTPDGAVVLDDAVAPSVELDVVTGELRIEPVCNRYLGSFSLDPDGNASFTVTGGTREACPDDAIEQQILEAFDIVDRWAETGEGLEITGPGSTVIQLLRN